MADKATLLALADRVRGMAKADNAVDVLVEIALFVPDGLNAAVRANFAGTKVIYTDPFGKEQAAWAWDWTTADRRSQTSIELTERARALSEGTPA